MWARIRCHLSRLTGAERVRADSSAGAVLPDYTKCGTRAARQRPDLVRSTQLPFLLLKGLLPRGVLGTDARIFTCVDIGLLDPGPHGSRSEAELRGDVLDRAVLRPQLLAELTNHPHRCGLLLVRVPTRRRLSGLISVAMAPLSLPRHGASTGPGRYREWELNHRAGYPLSICLTCSRLVARG